jgi:hemerythrin-like domain-containing protein
MIEHRLIERAIEILSVEKGRLEAGGELDPVFIDKMVDFIRTYADRCHHGKEEDILFESLHEKTLAKQEAELMRELVEEHKYGREVTQDLVASKVDDHFFPDTERHYDKEELDRMLKEFYDFDMQMIHEKYQKTVEALEREAKS